MKNHSAYIDYRTGDLGGFVFYFGTLPEDMSTAVQYEPLEAREIFYRLSRQRGVKIKKYSKHEYLVEPGVETINLMRYCGTLAQISGISCPRGFYYSPFFEEFEYGYMRPDLADARIESFHKIRPLVDKELESYECINEADVCNAAEWVLARQFNDCPYSPSPWLQEIAAEYAAWDCSCGGVVVFDYEPGYFGKMW